MEAMNTLGRQRACELAIEYRNKGYEVIEAPASEQLPDFLSGYQPDLLARKGDETVVIEIETRASLASDSHVRDLARLLQAKPGWNFELVVVKEEAENFDAPVGIRPFGEKDILQGLKTVRQLLASGDNESALLLLWPSVEAAVRRLVVKEKLALERLTPQYTFKQAVINGVISREDYNLLMHGMKYRNALVHGFKPADLDTTLLNQLVDTVERLLQAEAV